MACSVELQVEELAPIDLSVETDAAIDIGENEYIPASVYATYDGAVTVTPGAETQVLRTGDRVVLSDITINPIPNNYGLITWDGAVLTVS